MRLSLLSLTLIAAITICKGQSNGNEPCHCDQDLAFVTNYLENHYSGFRDNVTSSNRAAYEDLKAQLGMKSNEQQTKMQCFILLKEFLNFFRDNHLQMSLSAGGISNPEINEKSNEDIAKFKAGPLFQGRERTTLDSITIWSQLSHSSDELEGIYENDVYQIAIIQNKTSWRDYYGVITRSKTSLWEKGQVKMEIKRVLNSVYYVTTYSRNHGLGFRKIESGNPVIAVMSDLKKVYPSRSAFETKPNYSASPSGKWFQFKELNDSTTYLHIKTFNGVLKSKFDSAYKKVLPVILKKSNLIIDVRDNGGGSDNCWASLEKYLYTQPYREDFMEIYCSPETIKRDEEWLAGMQKNRKAYGWMIIKYFKVRIKRMKKTTPGTFLQMKDIMPWYAKPFFSSKETSHRKVYETPKKVILMFNRNSGSSAESFVITAMRSKKVLTFGDNTGGYLSFGDVRSVKTPSGFVLHSAITRIPNRFQYEKVGITPRIRANDQQDWIEQTNQLWKLMK